MSRFKDYLGRLTDAFGMRYVAAVVLTYGCNQGMGERFLFSAQNFYLLDTLDLKSQVIALEPGITAARSSRAFESHPSRCA